MGRPIGGRIVQVCGIVQRIGPCTARQVAQWMEGVEPTNVDKYCSRAVGFRLMTVERCYPKLYRVAPDWQEVLAAQFTPAKPLIPAPLPAASPLRARHPLETVWANFS